jgi:hypothetical protein
MPVLDDIALNLVCETAHLTAEDTPVVIDSLVFMEIGALSRWSFGNWFELREAGRRFFGWGLAFSRCRCQPDLKLMNLLMAWNYDCKKLTFWIRGEFYILFCHDFIFNTLCLLFFGLWLRHFLFDYWQLYLGLVHYSLERQPPQTFLS